MNKELNQEQSLKLIYEMIETSKTNIQDNAIFFLLWGWLVLLASIAHFVLIRLGWEYSYLPWPVMMVIGSVASVIIGKRMGQQSQTMTIIDKAMMFLWYGFFMVVVSIIVMASIGKMGWNVAQPMIIALYGLATFVSGGILKFKPLILGGIVAWICALVAFFVPYPYILLMVAVSIVFAYLVPGYMLHAKKDK